MHLHLLHNTSPILRIIFSKSSKKTIKKLKKNIKNNLIFFLPFHLNIFLFLKIQNALENEQYLVDDHFLLYYQLSLVNVFQLYFLVLNLVVMCIGIRWVVDHDTTPPTKGTVLQLHLKIHYVSPLERTSTLILVTNQSEWFTVRVKTPDNLYS